MQLAPIPFDEAQRIAALNCLRILDSEPEERFDRITRIAHRLFDIASVFISLVSNNRVWFKSKYGCELLEEPRDVSFCGHTICNVVTKDLSSRLFEVIDVENDPRFYDNSFITEACGTRYYMGFVLQSTDHHNVGTFCMTDTRPRTFSAMDKKLFSDLGLIVEDELNNYRFTAQLGASKIHSRISNEDNTTVHADRLINISDKLNSTLAELDEWLEKSGINYKEWRVLNEIVQTDFASPQKVSQKLNISAPLVSRNLESLESKGFIDRKQLKDGDRRVVRLICTDQGKEVWRTGINSANQLGNMYFKGILSQ